MQLWLGGRGRYCAFKDGLRQAAIAASTCRLWSGRLSSSRASIDVVVSDGSVIRTWSLGWTYLNLRR
eukprot:13496465-Alexandrium_andersonii.AAC.1